MTQKKIPMRQCIGCGEMFPKRELIRVVKPKEGDVSLEAHFLSNEKRKVAKFVVPSDGEWHTFSEAMEIDFDLAVTELAALQFKVSAPVDELCFKNLSLLPPLLNSSH